jgi:hypothetical protein
MVKSSDKLPSDRMSRSTVSLLRAQMRGLDCRKKEGAERQWWTRPSLLPLAHGREHISMLREYFSIVRVSESSKGFKITLPYKTNTTNNGRGDSFPQNCPISRIARIVLSLPVFEAGARMAPASICGSQLGRHICISYSQRQSRSR